MTSNIVKKIINKELNRFSNGDLYIFDFDETLVSDNAMAYVIKPNGNRIPISHKDYNSFIPEPGDEIDIREFEQVNNPIPNHEMINLLKSIQDQSIVLTARNISEPIANYLKTFEINVPVFAVGCSDPKLISAQMNAKNKTKWVESIINKLNIKNIEIWDDNKLNLYEIEKMCKQYPNVSIKTNLVVFER